MVKPLVLIIEDDPELSELYADILQMMDFDTETITDGQKAMERLEGTVPDLVLLDMHLPRVSGYNILTHIRAENRLSHIKVVVSTADTQLASTLRSKADAVYIKPITMSQLNDLAGMVSE